MRHAPLALLFTLACDPRTPASPDAPAPADASLDASRADAIDCPMPLRSRDRAPVASRGDARGLVDGDFWGPSWTGEVGDWVATPAVTRSRSQRWPVNGIASARGRAR